VLGQAVQRRLGQYLAVGRLDPLTDDPGVTVVPPAFPGNTPFVLFLIGVALAGGGLWIAPTALRGYGGMARLVLAPSREAELARRVEQLAQTRRETLDTAAAELRRIERDLHDGAQARLVAMGLTLDAAGRLIDTDPAAARALLYEARDTSARALAELRDLVRGIHPPVLADRGLADAIRALALDSPLRARVTGSLPGRPPAPVESAAYFAVSELLANVVQPGRRPDRDQHGCAVRVVIAEDLFLLRDGLIRLLEAYGFEVAAAVDNGGDFLSAVRSHRPDVAVVDVRLPPTFTDEGLRAALRARAELPGLPILVLSQYVEQLYARELLADGAQFTDAVKRVADGGTAMDPEVIARLLARSAATEGPLARLSPREREVLSLMAEGRSNAAIAARLVVTERAVAKHTASIFTKLDLQPSDDDNRRVLAVLAYLGR
jgi:DNA-binding NarL/FixJ family response regulator